MERVDSWKSLVALEQRFDRDHQEWVYRGQSSPAHRIRTTLERACVDFGARGLTIARVERAVLIDFKRSAHLYSTSTLPDDTDTLGWLALMRHYGAPSRLLDFSYSLFIATYFAAAAERARPVIWAVNKTWLAEHMRKRVLALPPGSDGKDGRQLLLGWYMREGWAVDRLLVERGTLPALVTPVGPMKTNDRLHVQQGLFLASTDVTVPFHDVLDRLPGSRRNVLKIRVIGADARFDILSRLHRTGLSFAALFPGLQGFAETFRPKVLHILKLLRSRSQGARVGPDTIGI
jgi:hypothetical protein